MLQHYLKVALRNLLNYKLHSFISVVCLAVGITCFSLMNHFISTVTAGEELPHYERRVNFRFSSPQSEANVFCRKADVDFLEGQELSGIDMLVASSYEEKTEVTVIDRQQRELPFLVQCRCVSPSYFAYHDKKLQNGNKEITAPDEVIISREFARKVFGKEDPTGLVIHLEVEESRLPNRIKDYRIVNVVESEDASGKVQGVDCYFPLSMNPYRILNVSAILSGQTTVESLNKQLDKITWKHEGMDMHAQAYSLAQRYEDVQRNIAILLARFIASLILLSGLINFLKFIIQMFYNRQRELALRKCMGSDTKGMFMLLFAEIFWMMSAAFLLSLAVTEIVLSLLHIYVPREEMIRFPLTDLYGLQFFLYIALLLICLSVIIYPIYRLRRLSIIHHIVQKQKRHVFRNIMIGLQLAISIFFVGSVYTITLAYGELFGKMYAPLSEEEEERVIALSANSMRMRQNIDAILSDISSLPGVTGRTSITLNLGLGSYTYINYEKDGKHKGHARLQQGDPGYFDFFHIPMEGKMVDARAEGTVYVSRKFKEQLQKDSIEGTVCLNGTDYRIVGTYEALYKEEVEGVGGATGSVFVVTPQTFTYYLKVSDAATTSEVIAQITEICRRYVPSTLSLDIRSIGDTKQTVVGAMEMTHKASILLAVVSILLVVLSVYSAISMDTVSRQKEVAIRKINGASPKTIGLLFGKVYLIIYLAAFCIVYPLLRLMLIEALGGVGLTAIYRWDWGILLFFVMALLMFLITAYKIYKVMHLNPASILKKE